MVGDLIGSNPMVLGIVVPILRCGVVECLMIQCPQLVPNPSPTFVVLVGRGTLNKVGAGIYHS